MLLGDKTGFYLLIASTIILAVLWIVLKIKTGRKAPTINPRLQKYAGSEGDVPRLRRLEADKIIATSSTSSVAGYELLEQVEAVFADGFRRPEEALEGIKAVAAMKGANAVINLRQERTAGGKCSASGDAVVIRKLEP